MIKIDTCGVAKGYVPTRRDQLLLLPPDVREWLPKNHLVWFLLDVIERMDTSVLHRRGGVGGVGRGPVVPGVVVGGVLCAGPGGVWVSLQIEKRGLEETAVLVVFGLVYSVPGPVGPVHL